MEATKLVDALGKQKYDIDNTPVGTRGRQATYHPSHAVGGLGIRKLTMNDWGLHNQHLTKTGHVLRENCVQQCTVSHETSDGVKLRTYKKQEDVGNNLSERLGHIQRGQDNLNVEDDLVHKEIAALEQVKADTEQMLRDMCKPLEISKKCIETREQRRCTDSVRDPPEENLFAEVRLIERICGMLQTGVQNAFEQLARLRQARQKIQDDLSDKGRAHGLDNKCKNLSECAMASFQYQYYNAQQNTMSSTPASWTAFYEHNIRVAAKERELSRALREKTVNLMNTSRCDLNAQKNAVESALRVRHNEMTVARDELSFNRRELQLEIAHAEEEIASLNQAIKDQVCPMKIAQTRYGTREYRPRMEHCHDDVTNQLKSQVHELTVDTKSLKEQLRMVNNRRKELVQTLSRVEDDLSSKMLSLDLDSRCLSLRS